MTEERYQLHRTDPWSICDRLTEEWVAEGKPMVGSIPTWYYKWSKECDEYFKERDQRNDGPSPAFIEAHKAWDSSKKCWGK